MFSYYKDKNFNRLSDLYTILSEAQEEDQPKEDQPESLSPEEGRKFENLIVRAKHKLRKNLPFFGIILSKLRTVPTDDIPTMAVDDYGNIYINPKFALKDLKESDVVGVLAHEAFHIANGTFMRQNNREMRLWNVATDYTMNRDLLGDMEKIGNKDDVSFPSMGLIPEKRGDKYFITFKNDPIIKGSVPDIDITDMAPETLYRALEKIRSSLPQPPPGPPGSSGSPGGPPSPPSGSGSGSGSSNDKDKNGGKKQLTEEEFVDALDKKQKELDNHLTKEEAEKIKPRPMPEGTEGGEDYTPDLPKTPGKEGEGSQKIKRIINQAEQEMKSRGEGPGGIPRGAAEVLRPKADWKVLLRDFMAKSQKTYYDMARPRKRAMGAGYYAPKRIQQQEVRLIIALDTSGSITQAEINTFVTEIVNLIRQFKNVKIVILLWNTVVYYPPSGGNLQNYIIETPLKSIDQVSQQLKKLPYESGGTTLSSIKQWLDRNKVNTNEYNGLLVFTDGHVEPNPQIPNIQNKLFMIITGGTDKILKDRGLPTAIVDVPPSR